MSILWNFLTLKVITVTDPVVWVLAGIWGVLVFAGIWSVRSREFGALRRILWGLAIIFLPVAGLLLYSTNCLLSAEWEVMRRMGFLSNSKKKIIDSLNAPRA